MIASSTELRRRDDFGRFVRTLGRWTPWLEGPEPGDDRDFLAAAIRCGVSFDPGSMFRALPSRDAPMAIRCGFSLEPRGRLAEAARRLAAAWRGHRQDRSPSRAVVAAS